jgi:hypothetical protein
MLVFRGDLHGLATRDAHRVCFVRYSLKSLAKRREGPLLTFRQALIWCCGLKAGPLEAKLAIPSIYFPTAGASKVISA